MAQIDIDSKDALLILGGLAIGLGSRKPTAQDTDQHARIIALVAKLEAIAGSELGRAMGGGLTGGGHDWMGGGETTR